MACKFTLVIFTALVFCGCGKNKPPTANTPKLPQTAQEAAAFAPIQIVDGEAETAKKEIKKAVTEALGAHDFIELEEQAAGFRTNATCFANGHSYLGYFYDSICLDEDDLDDARWNARLLLLTNWSEALPASSTPRIALAETWIGYAWAARGHGTADSVSDDNGKKFDERTESGLKVLLAARTLKNQCPMFWREMQIVGLDMGWDKSDYDQAFLAATKLYPSFYDFYFNKSNYLQPRWYGEEGEWEKYVADAADKLGGEQGDILYARCAWNLLQMRLYKQLYQSTQISWPRVKKGFEALHRLYPDSLDITSEFCMEAGMNNEHDLMRDLFTELRGRVDLPIWDDKRRFEAFRDWAFDRQ